MKTLLRVIISAAFTRHSILATAAGVPINTTGPILQPSYPACAQFHLAGVGEDCNVIISAAHIDRAEFFRINPAVGGEKGCKNKIAPHTWYCIMSKDGSVRPAPLPTADPEAAPTSKLPLKGGKNPDVPQSQHKVQPGRTKDADESKITRVSPDDCRFGDCWYAFGTLSTGDAQKLASATSLCHSVFSKGYGGKHSCGWPGDIQELCGDCETLSSACPCFLAGHYHTRTANPMYSRPWDGENWHWPGR